MLRRAIVALPMLLVFPAGCAGDPDERPPDARTDALATEDADAPPHAAADVRVWTPPDDWAEIPPAAFEELVETHLPADVITRIDGTAIPSVAARLDEGSPRSVRAAVMLGRSRTRHAGELLLQRLEKRVLGPDRSSDAGDVVAACALARFPAMEAFGPRLARLAVGANPHPDLEVRVECASTALAAGRDEVIPLLLQVLRIDTWDGRADERDFPDSPTTAWARDRAARALSARARVPVTYRADGSIVHRQEEARRLQELLGVVRPRR